MNKKIKIGIIWANPYNKNLGVAALSYSCLSIFSQIFRENNINAKIIVFGGHGKPKDKIKIDKREIEFFNVPGLNIYNWKSIIKFIFFPTIYRIWRVFNLDMVFDISDGDSFTDIYGIKRFKRILNSKKFFSHFCKKQVMLPQTIGPFNKKDFEKSAFEVMGKMIKVIARDKQSYNYASQFLSQDKLSENIDVAFFLPFNRTSFKEEKLNIGLNVSALLWHCGYTKNNQFNLLVDYQKLIDFIIKYFLSQTNSILHLVPHVVPKNKKTENDYSIAESLIQKYPNIILPPRFKDPIEAKSYISGLDFFIGSRMHSCIAAFSTGVPVFPMSYSRKFNGLFIDTLNYKWLGDLVNDKSEDIFQDIKNAFNKREQLSKIISYANENIVIAKKKDLIKQLSEYLNAFCHESINH